MLRCVVVGWGHLGLTGETPASGDISAGERMTVMMSQVEGLIG